MATYRLTQYIKRSFNLQWNTERRNTQKLQCYFEGWRILMKTSFSKRSDCRNYVWKSSRVNWVWRFDQIWPNSITYKVQWRCNPCIKYFHHTSKKFTSNFMNEDPGSCRLQEIGIQENSGKNPSRKPNNFREIKKSKRNPNISPRNIKKIMEKFKKIIKAVWVCDPRNSDWIVC